MWSAAVTMGEFHFGDTDRSAKYRGPVADSAKVITAQEQPLTWWAARVSIPAPWD